jgi:hypothetical protein
MNEFQLLSNPTNVPEAVSTGYQRQNTNLFVLQTGLDTTEPYDDGSGVIEIPAGGIVEVNGSLFKLTSNFSISKPNASTAYWVAVLDNGDGAADISLTTRPGVWDPAKKGCYTVSGARTLNWVSSGELDNVTEFVWLSQNIKGKWEPALAKGWYYAVLASGLGSGTGGNAGNRANVGYGGVASVSRTAAKIFFWRGGELPVYIGGSGFNGNNGNPGAGASSGSDNNAGAGGGGGSGGGERSSIRGIMETEFSPGGAGGYGGARQSSTILGGAGGTGAVFQHGNSDNGAAASDGAVGGDGGGPGGGGGGGGGQKGTGSTVTPGSGGVGGISGYNKENGTPGGYCNIYKLEN